MAKRKKAVKQVKTPRKKKSEDKRYKQSRNGKYQKLMSSPKYPHEIEQFYKLIETYGPLNISVPRYAEETGVPERLVRAWKQSWMENFGKQWLNKFAPKAAAGAIAAITILSEGLRDKDGKSRRQNAREYLAGLKDYNAALGKTDFKLFDEDLEPQQIIINQENTILSKLDKTTQQKIIQVLVPENKKDDTQ